MKNIQLAVIASVLTGILNTAQAQEKPKPFIGVFGGISNVSGNFAKADYQNAVSGFAKNGYVFGLEGAFYLGKNLGLGAVASTGSYGANTQPLAAGYREDFDVDKAQVNMKPYRTTNVLVGPHFTIPLNRLSIDIRVLAGVAMAVSPEIKVLLEDEATFSQ